MSVKPDNSPFENKLINNDKICCGRIQDKHIFGINSVKTVDKKNIVKMADDGGHKNIVPCSKLLGSSAVGCCQPVHNIKRRKFLPNVGEIRQMSPVSNTEIFNEDCVRVNQTMADKRRAKRQRKKARKKAAKQSMPQSEEQQQKIYARRKQFTKQISPTILAAVIPLDCQFVVKRSNYACEGIKFRIELNLQTKEEFFAWLKNHEAISGVKYLPKNLQDNPSSTFAFKGFYQCNAFITAIGKNGPTRTRCPSRLQVSILGKYGNCNHVVRNYFAVNVTIEFNHKHRRNVTAKSVVSEQLRASLATNSAMENRSMSMEVDKEKVQEIIPAPSAPLSRIEVRQNSLRVEKECRNPNSTITLATKDRQKSTEQNINLVENSKADGRQKTTEVKNLGDTTSTEKTTEVKKQVDTTPTVKTTEVKKQVDTTSTVKMMEVKKQVDTTSTVKMMEVKKQVDTTSTVKMMEVKKQVDTTSTVKTKIVTENRSTSTKIKPEEVSKIENVKPKPEIIDLVDDDDSDDESSFIDKLVLKIKTLQGLKNSEIKIDMIFANNNDFRVGIIFLSTLKSALEDCRILFIHRIKIMKNYDIIVVSVDNSSKKLPFIVFITSTNATNLSSVILTDCKEIMSGLDVDKVEIVITDMPSWKVQIRELFPKAIVSTSVHLIIFNFWIWLWKRDNLAKDDSVRCSLFALICRLYNVSNREDFDCLLHTTILPNNNVKQCSNFLEYLTAVKTQEDVFTSDVDNKNIVEVVRHFLLSDVIVLVGCNGGDLFSFLDLLLKYSCNQNEMLRVLEEKVNNFNFVDASEQFCKVKACDDNKEYIVDKIFGFCNCDVALKGRYCLHRLLFMFRQFQQKSFEIDVEVNNFEVAKSAKSSCLLMQQEKLNVDDEIVNVPVEIKSLVTVNEVDTESWTDENLSGVEKTKRKLDSFVKNVMERWNEDTKKDIENAVKILHDRCFNLTSSELCSFLQKI